MVLEECITAYERCRATGTEAWSWNSLSRPISGEGRLGQNHGSWIGLSRSMGGVGRLGQKPRLGTVYHSLWAVQGDWDRSMVLELSITDDGRCNETGREAWSWNDLSRPRDDIGRLGQKHGLGMVYHSVWAFYGDWERSVVLEGSITA